MASSKPPRHQDPLATPVAPPDGELLEQVRHAKPTPFHHASPTLLMLEPSSATMQACIRVAVELRVRPVSATTATLDASAASTRPLVIVVESANASDEEKLADVAFGVGALIVRVAAGEPADVVEQRVRGAVEASVRLRDEG